MNHVHADGEGKPVVTNTSTATAGCIAASLRQAAELIEAGAPIHSGGIMVQTEETVVRITSDLVLHRIAIPLPGAYAPTEQPLHEKSQPKSDREADRARFTDKDFNRWLDDGISDAGHTVWDAVGCIASAWAGWEARSMLNWNAHQLEHPEAVTTQALLAEVQELIGNEYMDARARRRLTGWLEKAQAFMAPTEPGLPYPTVPSLIGLAEVLPPKPIDGAPYMATMTAPQAKELHKRFGALVRALAEYPQKNTHQLQAAKVCAGVEKLADTFRNAGDSEANFIAGGDRLNCPACGGSGHVDDASQRITQGDVVAIASELARIDGYDPGDEQGGLYHVVWSGQPPEPMGDVWNLEYLPKGERIAKALGYRERPTVNAEQAAP